GARAARRGGVRVVQRPRRRGARAGPRARGRELQAARRAAPRRARSRLGLLELQLVARDAKLGREDFARDPVAVTFTKLALRLGHGEHDPVRQLEAALLAERIDEMDELVRLPLEHELVVEAEVERNRDPVAGGDRPALAPTAPAEDLVRLELPSGHPDASARQLLELARGERLTHRPELTAELRPEHRQVRLDPQLDRLDRPEFDVLDAQLVRDLFLMAVEARAL